MILKDLFEEYLELSAKYRPEYPVSLGEAHGDNLDILENIFLDIPEIYTTIYTKVCGTEWEIKEQELMDFIPGYRLIHIKELIQEKKKLDLILEYIDTSEFNNISPVLGNYSSDFICFGETKQGEEFIISVFHDDASINIMHNNINIFFETICKFYKEGVYYLDEDGYLDYDLEREVQIAKEINPGIEYWEQ